MEKVSPLGAWTAGVGVLLLFPPPPHDTAMAIKSIPAKHELTKDLCLIGNPEEGDAG